MRANFSDNNINNEPSIVFVKNKVYEILARLRFSVWSGVYSRENHSKINTTSNFIKEVIPGKSHILARIAENPSLHPQTLFCTKRFIRKRGHFPATSVTNPSKFYHP